MPSCWQLSCKFRWQKATEGKTKRAVEDNRTCRVFSPISIQRFYHWLRPRHAPNTDTEKQLELEQWSGRYEGRFWSARAVESIPRKKHCSSKVRVFSMCYCVRVSLTCSKRFGAVFKVRKCLYDIFMRNSLNQTLLRFLNNPPSISAWARNVNFCLRLSGFLVSVKCTWQVAEAGICFTVTTSVDQWPVSCDRSVFSSAAEPS